MTPMWGILTSLVKTGVYNAGTKLHNALQSNIKMWHHNIKVKDHSSAHYYSAEEFCST